MAAKALRASTYEHIALGQIRNPEATLNPMYNTFTARTHAILNYAVENHLMELAVAEKKAEDIRNLPRPDSRGASALLPSINTNLLKTIGIDHKTALRDIPGYEYPAPNLRLIKRFANIFKTYITPFAWN